MGKKLLYFSFFIFHFSFAQQGTWFWGHEGIGDAWVMSTVTDIKGNCYTTGLFQNNTIQFGSYTVTNTTTTNSPYTSDEDAYLVKYAPNGTVLWATQTFEKNSNLALGNNAPESVQTDNFGNVYLCGNFIDTLYIGSYMLIVPPPDTLDRNNIYLAKYNSNGVLIWAKQTGTCVSDSSYTNEKSISCDNTGNIYITGCFAGIVNFGSITLTAPSLSINTFLTKYDSSGNVLWAKQAIGDIYNNTSWGVATDKFGNAFITGNFYDSVTFGSDKLVNANPNNSDFYLVKYNPNGNVLWAKTLITPGPNAYTSGAVGWALTTDLTGNVYVDGQAQDTVIFSQDTLVSPQYSFFLAKYDLTGNVLWAKIAGVLDNNDWYVEGLTSDNSKHIYLTAEGGGAGMGLDEIAFNDDTLNINDTAVNGGPSVIFKLDSNGKVLCSSIISIGGGGFYTSVASDTSGNYVYLGGNAKSVAVFGKDTINPFAYPINPIQKAYFFPFIARWEECDSNVLYTGVQNRKPVGTEVKVYPNPNNGVFIIALQNVNEPCQVEVYNVLGEKILAEHILSSSINISNQPNGIYLYRVITQDGNLVGEGKLIIQK